MKVDIECHKCKEEFEAEWDVRGKCQHCENKYDWAWDGKIWSDTETCLPIFESESEGVKNYFFWTLKSSEICLLGMRGGMKLKYAQT